MSYVIIAAIGKNNELGKSNNLIWHLPKDLKFFREQTTGHSIIMGRKTFESLPKMLPNRKHIVLSSSNNFPPDVEVFDNIESLLNKYNKSDEDIFVIGGASIYKAFIDYTTKMYLTEIDSECKEADAYFPNFDKDDWLKEELDQCKEDNIEYKHILYKKK